VMGTTPQDLLRRVEPPPAEMTETPQSVMPTTLDRAVVGGLRALGAPAPQARGINQLLSKSVGMLVPDPERIYNQMSEAVKEDDYSKMIGPSIDAAIGYVPLIGPAARLAMPPVKAATTSALDFGRSAGREMLRPIDQAMFGEGPLGNALSMAAPLQAAPRVQAPVSRLGFYDPVEQAGLNIQRKQGPGQAFLNELQRSENVSKDFLEASGIAEKLRTAPNITRDEVQAMTKGAVPEVEELVLGDVKGMALGKEQKIASQLVSSIDSSPRSHINLTGMQGPVFSDEALYYLQDGTVTPDQFPEGLQQLARDYINAHKTAQETKNIPTKWDRDDLILPGGSNYREVLLTVPSKRPSIKNMSRAEYNAAIEEADRLGIQNFESSHWDEPNVVSHIRMNDRTDFNGNKVLFIEEMQSDWAQQGRKKGFGQEVPEGPFVKNTNEWVDLSLKNIIKRAVDEGYDRVAFINGKQSADRYDLAKYVDSVRWDSDHVFMPKGAEKEVTLFMKDYGYILLPITPEGVVIGAKQGGRQQAQFNGKRLDEIVGRDVANKIMAGESGSLEGEGLSIGGEGMKKFYDQIVPDRLRKLVGKDKVKHIPGAVRHYGDADDYEIRVDRGGNSYYLYNTVTGDSLDESFNNLSDAHNFLEKLNQRNPALPQLGFDITPEIREKFSKPIPYKKGGAVRISDNPDTMLLELMNAPRMQEGGKPPPGIRRAMAQQRGTVAPIPGIKTPAEFIGGYVGADPRFSVMDPDADALERAYRAGEATSVIGDIFGSISPFATASTLARANALPGAAVVKGTAKKAFTARELKSETNKVAKAIAKDNPKMKPEDVQKRAATIAEKNLTWTKEQKPELEKTYGQLVQAPASASVGERLQNVPEVVSQRARKAEEFLAQPTEPWQPPRPELQAFDRAMIKDAMEGFPGIEQTAFPRYTPPKADLSYIEEIYQDPRNRALIEAQIKRGLPLGGETFYASLYPMKMAALERGIPEEKFNQFIYSTAPASARNSILNEMAVGQFLRDMNARGLPLDEETVKREMAAFKEKYGKGLPLMPIHREGVKNVLEGNLDLREQLKADIPTNYKIPTYGTQKAGDFGKSVVLDVHEAAGQTQGSRFHPYFSEQGGFGSREYGAAEQQMMDIAKGLGLPGGTAQAGRWFGGGELTGLVSPRGDALDLLERQAAYTLNGMGIKPTPRNVRNYLLDMIETGEGVLMPYYSKNVPMPDVRTEKKKGGAVRMSKNLNTIKYELAMGKKGKRYG
jgi:hypothetical protein